MATLSSAQVLPYSSASPAVVRPVGPTKKGPPTDRGKNDPYREPLRWHKGVPGDTWDVQRGNSALAGRLGLVRTGSVSRRFDVVVLRLSPHAVASGARVGGTVRRTVDRPARRQNTIVPVPLVD